MKLIIDIPEESYNDIQSRDWKNGELIFSEEWKAIHNGTPIPDNATFGDTFEKVFRPFKVVKEGLSVDVYRTKSRFENNIVWFTFSIMQWNAPYQKGGDVCETNCESCTHYGEDLHGANCRFCHEYSCYERR